jgi:hypothetical protein
MAQNKALEVWNGLPTWAKGVIAVGGVAILYFTGRSIWRAVKGKKEQTNAREVVRTQGQELTAEQRKGIKQSFPDSQYKAWADRLQNQYDGIDWKNNVFDYDVPVIGQWSGSGKVTSQIVSQLKNDVDFLKLSQAWGVRTYDQAGLLTGDVTGTLSYCVNDELDNGEVAALNKMLSKQGIKYKF